MDDDQLMHLEHPCECGAKFIIVFPRYTVSGKLPHDLVCGICKRQIRILLPADKIEYESVAPDQDERSDGTKQS
jgi:hypothetical protein